MKFIIFIPAPDPGDSPASEASGAIPDEPVLVGLDGFRHAIKSLFDRRQQAVYHC